MKKILENDIEIGCIKIYIFVLDIVGWKKNFMMLLVLLDVVELSVVGVGVEWNEEWGEDS